MAIPCKWSWYDSYSIGRVILHWSRLGHCYHYLTSLRRFQLNPIIILWNLLELHSWSRGTLAGLVIHWYKRMWFPIWSVTLQLSIQLPIWSPYAAVPNNGFYRFFRPRNQSRTSLEGSELAQWQYQGWKDRTCQPFLTNLPVAHVFFRTQPCEVLTGRFLLGAARQARMCTNIYNNKGSESPTKRPWITFRTSASTRGESKETISLEKA